MSVVHSTPTPRPCLSLSKVGPTPDETIPTTSTHHVLGKPGGKGSRVMARLPVGTHAGQEVRCRPTELVSLRPLVTTGSEFSPWGFLCRVDLQAMAKQGGEIPGPRNETLLPLRRTTPSGVCFILRERSRRMKPC